MVDDARAGFGTSNGAGEIFQLLRDGRARTKADLASVTGLARSTVSTRVDALLDSDLLASAGEGASTGGRPPARVAMNNAAGSILAVDLGASHATVGLATIAGDIVETTTRALDISLGPEHVLSMMIDDASSLLDRRSHAPVVGVGIGVPGPVEHSTGRPTHPPIMPGWDRFDVPGFIHDRWPVPVLVDNDVNILALGEQAVSWPEVDDLIFVKVSTGIGAGIIAGGMLQRGAQGSAGDIGHVQVPYRHDSPRDPRDERDLEAIASAPAIAAELRARGITVGSNDDVVELIRAGNPDACDIARHAGREVGEVLAGMVNLLNPEIIVIGGSIARAAEHLLEGIREVVYRRSIPLATQHLDIVQSRAGATAGVVGAAKMVSNHVLDAAFINARLADGGRFTDCPTG